LQDAPVDKTHIYERAFDFADPAAFVVDDEAQVRTFVSNVLRSSGFVPHQFTSSAEVEAALPRLTPQLIVLDLSLGDSDAIEVLRNLAAVRFHGDVVLISGHDPATVDEVQKIGEHRGLNMLAPLHKPFRVDELRERIAPVIRTAQSNDTSLGTALQNRWLELWYQPKIDLRTMLVCGAEALIRMRHPQHGVMPPSRFLPPPGDPLYRPLTDYIVQQSLSDWTTFSNNKMSNRLAINVPASILQRPDFVANLRRHIPRHPRFPGLIVEITEDEAISDPKLAHEIAVQLKLYNVHVSIDDFGSGYSSLSRLKELPFAEIKLDRSFVRGCAKDRRKRAMCETVVELARRFGIVSVAEGVETEEDLRVISDVGYDVAQGYYFARPLTSNAFVDLVTSRAVSRPVAP
jgi:EAL domain-containing protein (putative c-di-GMP-specific phosphodiesterase class I)/ActR/RegA family two-component response regulator